MKNDSLLLSLRPDLLDFSPWVLIVGMMLGYLLGFAFVLRQYRMAHFLSEKKCPICSEQLVRIHRLNSDLFFGFMTLKFFDCVAITAKNAIGPDCCLKKRLDKQKFIAVRCFLFLRKSARLFCYLSKGIVG